MQRARAEAAESRVAELERDLDACKEALQGSDDDMRFGPEGCEDVAPVVAGVIKERDDLKRRVVKLEQQRDIAERQRTLRHNQCVDAVRERDSARASLAAAEERVRVATRAWLHANHDRDSARAALAKAKTVVEHARWAADYLTRGDGTGLAMPLEKLISSVRALDALPPQPEQPAAPRIVDTGPRAPTIRSTTPRQPSVPGEVVAEATGAEQPAAPEPQPAPSIGVADEPHGPTLAAALVEWARLLDEHDSSSWTHRLVAVARERAAKVRGGVEGGDRE